jgi:hypothetical protein
MQNDTTLENLKAMTDATLEYGVYRSPSSPSAKVPLQPAAHTAEGLPAWITAPRSRPGSCRAFDEKLKELPPISGDPALVRRVWDDVDGLAYIYIWHLVLSF